LCLIKPGAFYVVIVGNFVPCVICALCGGLLNSKLISEQYLIIVTVCGLLT
jgi:hypothetical protein